MAVHCRELQSIVLNNESHFEPLLLAESREGKEMLVMLLSTPGTFPQLLQETCHLTSLNLQLVLLTFFMLYTEKLYK